MTVGMGAALGEIHAGSELREIQRRLLCVHLQPQQRLQARPRPGDHPQPARRALRWIRNIGLREPAAEEAGGDKVDGRAIRSSVQTYKKM
ncbi:hypothetical protein EJB05_42569 [Eragrostis curvula]|uniref:Uncharacterized protein n=1 Tax=Eragrostis curvula TaxID=38414 RepID=A0A5J9TDS1_9POAL|nr:hypothetical protein EJB05_42569 [Eragrostis curvula]